MLPEPQLILLLLLLIYPLASSFPVTSTISVIEKCPKECSCKQYGMVAIVECTQGGLHNDDLLRVLSQLPENVASLHFNPSRGQPNNFSITNAFGRFKRLTDLRLRNSGIQTLGKRIFEQLPHLRFLDLSENHIDYISLEAFENTDRLEALYLDSNRLNKNYLPSASFSNLPTLKVLSFRDNAIAYIPSNLFGGLENLVELHLDGNHLQSIASNAFDNLPNLKTLTLNHCGLDKIPKALYIKNSNLQRLELGYNKLTTIPTDLAQYLPRLEVLDLSGNFISLVPDMALAGTSVHSLLLGGNLLGVRDASFAPDDQGIQPHAFYGSNISELDLSYNRFHRFSSKTLRSATETLKVLHLSANPLGAISPEQIAGLPLTGLHISDIGLFELPSNLPSEFRRLELLNISRNAISHLSQDQLAQLTNLRTIDISSSRFSELPAHLLRFIRRIQRVYLANNPWNCNCDIMELRDLLRSMYYEIAAEAEAADVISSRSIQDHYYATNDLYYATTTTTISSRHSAANDWLFAEQQDIRCYSPKQIKGIPIARLDDSIAATSAACQSPIFGAVGLTKESEIGILATGALVFLLLVALAGVVAYTYLWLPRSKSASYKTGEELNVSASSSEHSANYPVPTPLGPLLQQQQQKQDQQKQELLLNPREKRTSS